MFDNKIVILSEFFKIVRPLIKYKFTNEIKMLYNAILKHILFVLDKEELHNECTNLIDKTLGLQTIGDTLAANIDLIKNIDEKKIFEIKSKYIIEDKINILLSFDKDMFIINLINDTNRGCVESWKLYAILNYLGLYIEKDEENSIFLLKMLAYNGDEFAMHSLSSIYKTKELIEKHKKWSSIVKHYQVCKKNVLPLAKLEKCNEFSYSEDILQCVQIILCLEKRNKEKENLLLDIPLTYYLVESKDHYQEKIQNIYSNDSGYVILLKSELNKNRKYEF